MDFLQHTGHISWFLVSALTQQMVFSALNPIIIFFWSGELKLIEYIDEIFDLKVY